MDYLDGFLVLVGVLAAGLVLQRLNTWLKQKRIENLQAVQNSDASDLTKSVAKALYVGTDIRATLNVWSFWTALVVLLLVIGGLFFRTMFV
ncbi:MAG: hypothetical protein V4474_04170 [Patescibacteria group bacterium]